MTDLRDDEYRVSVVDHPGALTEDAAARLTAEFITLSWRCTGGDNWRSYALGRESWTRYYHDQGNRPADYERLSLVYYAGDLVHFTSLQIVSIESTTFVWVHVGMTHPDHRGRGLLARSVLNLLSPTWLASLPAPMYVVFRSPNPITYVAMQSLVETYKKHFDICYFPRIIDDESIAPIPLPIQTLARRIAAQLSPDRPFEVDKFVIRGYFQSYDTLYKEFAFPCADARVDSYFRRHVSEKDRDGVMVLVELSPKASHAEVLPTGSSSTSS